MLVINVLFRLFIGMQLIGLFAVSLWERQEQFILGYMCVWEERGREGKKKIK